MSPSFRAVLDSAFLPLGWSPSPAVAAPPGWSPSPARNGGRFPAWYCYIWEAAGPPSIVDPLPSQRASAQRRPWSQPLLPIEEVVIQGEAQGEAQERLSDQPRMGLSRVQAQPS